MRSTLYLFVILIITVFGCSADRSDPISYDAVNQAESVNSLPIIACDGSTAIGMLGVYNLVISPDGYTAELVPLRTPLLGESYVVSGASFFTITPCNDCLKVENIALDEDSRIVLGMKVKHPFPKGDELKPPSALNRLDLDVFDLALGISPFGDGNKTYFSQLNASAQTGILYNADGYTTELSSLIGDDAAIPYKTCYESENNNRFEMSTDYQPFECVFVPGEETTFTLYLTMGYGASAKKPQRLFPTYYVPEFNRKAAWRVEVTPPVSPDTWNASDNTTEYPVTIDIYDWNHGAQVAAGFPDPENTDYIYAASDVGAVTLEVPGMTSSLVSATTTDTTTNGWDDPLTYIASFPNELGLAGGEYNGLVKVTDTRNPGSVILGGETDTLANSPDGILLSWHELDEFATYQIFSATILEDSPVCDVEVVTAMPYVGWATRIEFDASASYDPHGSDLIYEWDFDDDGSFGDSYDSGTDANPQKLYDSVYIGRVCVKVSRDGAPGESSCCVDVDIKAYPLKNIDISNGNNIARDLAIDPQSGDILVYYEQGDVRRYFLDNFFSDFETYQCFWATEENLGTHNPDRDYYETGDYIDINTDGDFIIAVHRRYNDPPPAPYTNLRNVWGYFYSSDGTEIINHHWHDTWFTAWQAHVFDAHAYPASYSFRSRDMGFTWEYGSGGIRENNHVTWQDPDYLGFTDCKEGGTGLTGYPIVPFTGCRVAATETDMGLEYIWILMKQNTVAWLWHMHPVLSSPSGAWTEIGPRFGTHSADNLATLFTPLPYENSTTDDDGLYCGQDITRDNTNMYFILDRHNPEEPFEWRIKTFTYTVMPPETTPTGGFGDASDWELTPIRIEGSDHDGKVAVLHVSETQSMLSVFLESETP